MNKLHALLIAIDTYHPDSKVRNLSGCGNDIKIVQEFISKYYTDLNPSLLVLQNEKATRDGLLIAFQEHLIEKAKPGDTIIFYYSGHGSTAETAEEFRKFDGQEQDESLVCYDSRLEGNYDVTDKEIAVLLSRIQDGVHTVVIADSCHSASINRTGLEDNYLGESRFTKRRKKERSRPLDSYLLEEDNYYKSQWEENNEIIVPRSKHILLAACNRDELALETRDNRGLFSTILLNKLQENQNISYSDLFAKVRHTIEIFTKKQNPILEVREGFNPNTVFLRKDVKVNHKRHLIKFYKNQWLLEYGAIHGLPISSGDVDKIGISIYSNVNAKEQIASVGVTKVALKETVLDWEQPLEENIYWGEIQNLPTGMIVRLEGTETGVNDFFENYYHSPSPFLQLDRYSSDAKYFLQIKSNQILIFSTKSQKLIHGIYDTTNIGVQYIKEILECIEEWERLSKLMNESTKIGDAVEFLFIDETNEDNSRRIADKNITLDYPNRENELDDEGDKIVLYYSIEARNTSSKDLYVALLHLDYQYGVNIFFPCQKIPADSEFITLDDSHGLHVDSQENEVVDIFKLIISREPFDDYKFQKEGFEFGKISPAGSKRGTRSIIRRRRKTESDWYTDAIVVNTVRG